MLRRTAIASFIVFAGAGSSFATDEDVPEKRSLSIIGEVERVHLADAGLSFAARIDTGATSTSIDARNIEEFERDGDPWVRFEVRTNDDDSAALERKVVDRVDIVSAGDTEDERLVVELELCLSDVLRTVEVNLADRKGLNYRLLVGRDLLSDGGFLVNVAQKFSHEPTCDGIID
ncbi:ATP-dependent zinc protease [Parvularcula sp. ZS-1/3]|uniref:ATP-dependent zinc protease n=1 Tax=Parvularcula mediterranea TaxID=2732508 RepID=A0A7Y3RKH5_9PROT|nr:RimK/LysX family protein [Parvularcula mediterranea]NNU15733.1 ATP-dependent zinc protease [Parvularcula mediterranea]